MAKSCLKCDKKIPTWITLENRRHNLSSRKYCLECSPFGVHNNRKIHLPLKEKVSPRFYQEMNNEEKKSYNQKIYQYQKKQRLSIKCELISMLGGGCAKCGYDKNINALCFHHKNPQEKLFPLDSRNLASKKKDDILKEAKKCQLLCHNCHVEIHYPNGFDWKMVGAFGVEPT